MEGSKRNQASATLPPRTLNVQKFVESRAVELESLHSIVSNRLKNDFRTRRNKRKRTSSYDNRIARNRHRKRQKLGQLGPRNKDEASILEKDQKKLPRRILRRIELRKNPTSGFCTSGDGTRRLRTHLWHAKRFTMTKQWGFHLPLGLQGRGRASRALLKWFRKGALLHDASYYSAFQLEGPQDSLMSILKMVLVTNPSVYLGMQSTSILSGVYYGSAMLHYVGAPSSQVIAPVTYMWRPYIGCNSDVDGVRDLSLDELNVPERSLYCSSFRQMWIWIHAAAFGEGFEAIKIACQKHMHETGISVSCFSLEGRLAKLEIMGEKAIEFLQQILHPRASDGLKSKGYSVLEANKDNQILKPFMLEHAVDLPSHAILSLTVEDPRDLSKKEIVNVPEDSSPIRDGDVLGDESNRRAALIACKSKDKEVISSWFKDEANSVLLSENKDLWDIGNTVTPPVEENLLCMERHQRRMAFFHLDNESSGLQRAENEQSSGLCPILLLKNSNQKGTCTGWSIILPLSWVKAFWIPLVTRGAHAIGLREKRWIACDVELPCFPFDFPDSNSYSGFMGGEAIASDQNMERRPLAMRPFRVPIPPPWNSVRSALGAGSTCMKDIQTLGEKFSIKEADPGNVLRVAVTENCDLEFSDQSHSLFEGFVVRTSSVLSSLLNDIYGNDLLLFPNALMGVKAKLLKDGVELSIGSEGATQISLDRRLCFVRVLIHAYKDGAFEEGSVVCAPRLTDIELWMSRSEERGGLQISQSSVASYFMQQPSGEWQLCNPENPATMESYRLPIGFVTTGFVRGSSKPVAGAFCEATLLAQLRREQWESFQVEQRKWEIFVLVRNMRSAAYRLALATIVLERQEEDVEFL